MLFEGVNGIHYCFEVCASRTIKLDCGVIVGVCEYKKEGDVLLCTKGAHGVNEARAEALALKIGVNGQVVEKQFGLCRGVTWQDVGSASTDEVFVCEDCKDRKMRRLEQLV